MSNAHNPPQQSPHWPQAGRPPSRPQTRPGKSAVPPPKRDQRPRPAAQTLPQSRSQSEINSLQQQLQQPPRPAAPRRSQTPADPDRPSIWVRLGQNWTLWSLVALSLVGGLATASAISLFRIPNLPNCRAIFWPTAAASTRLQCADAYAEQGTVEGLLAAIALVEALSDDHPLQTEINERVETWAEQILNIADRTFHEGNLEQAIQIARRIPEQTSAAEVVSARIERWQSIWKEAEATYQKAEDQLRASQFREAFSTAIQLRGIGNDYWETTQYEKLVSLISTTRADANALGQARRLADQGSVSAVLEALAKVQAIDPSSYMHGEAQRLLRELSRQLLDLAEDALAREDGAGAMDILAEIPTEADLNAEIRDFRTLAEAYELTWTETPSGYEAAIARLQSIGDDRPLYGRARSLIQRWRQEVQGLAQLNWARQVAEPGTLGDLQAAIAEAENIDPSNPRWEEAQQQIDRWQRRISEIEDGPYLNRAKALAARGDRAALQSAIDTAQAIGPDSALYEETQDLIGEWRWRIQEMNNQPVLAQAERLASQGNVPAAIQVAAQIPAGQALYDEAQSAIADWRERQSGNQQLQQAYRAAQTGTVDALVEAINLAQTMPEGSATWTEAQRAANQWSWRILQMAEQTASSNVGAAIAIAERVPTRTEAYASAQLQIEEWRSRQESSNE